MSPWDRPVISAGDFYGQSGRRPDTDTLPRGRRSADSRAGRADARVELSLTIHHTSRRYIARFTGEPESYNTFTPKRNGS